MSLVVQKYGGTSVADADRILAAAGRAVAAHREGHRVVVVVSARGDTTDELIELARQINPRPPARELDMLLSTGEQVSVALMAMACHRLGVPAISFTGGQTGIVTDSTHTKARIRDIGTDRVRAALDAGQIAIVAGFQGIDNAANITTLGRGGSDTTAVAIAAVLGAEACEIYTDVEGVFTTDPRVVPEARKIERISYDEMLELASLGAGVMHSRSIEFAKKHRVPIHVRSAFTGAPGTWIVDDVDARRLGADVTGAALSRREARITFVGVPDRPGVVQALFEPIAAANIVVDMIVQNVATAGTTEVSFTVAEGDLEEALAVAGSAAELVGAAGVTHDSDVAKVSAVGLGMLYHTGVATRMFEALAREQINIQMITTSEIKISVLVSRSQAEAALAAVHRAFELDALPPAPLEPFAPRFASFPSTSGIELVREATRTGLEDLVISGVEFDDRQGRITVLDVPDRPGVAAGVLRRVAEANVYVDMIVQNVSTARTTHLSFTVFRRDIEAACQAVLAEVERANLAVEPEIAKLSVDGVGMRSHADVAARMFGALAAEGININLINTSEVRINVATRLDQGRAALECLARAFGLPSERPATPAGAAG